MGDGNYARAQMKFEVPHRASPPSVFFMRPQYGILPLQHTQRVTPRTSSVHAKRNERFLRRKILTDKSPDGSAEPTPKDTEEQNL